MPDLILVVGLGTGLFLLLALFIAFMTLSYQRRRLRHREEVTGLVKAYDQEILRARLEVQEQTHLAISQEIHDNVGQVLSLVRLHLCSLETTLPNSSLHKLQDSKVLLDQALQDLRNLSKRLNGKYLQNQPLVSLLQFQLEQLQKTGAMTASLHTSGGETPLSPEKKLLLFRITQEALANVIRHAAASTVLVQVNFADHHLTLSIRDDGRGFTATAPNRSTGALTGTGIHNMKYRAGLIGASLAITGNPGVGTEVLLTLPLP